MAHPNRVNTQGGLYVEKDGRDTPDTFRMTVDYPSQWSLCLVSTLTNDTNLPDRIFGKYGTLEIGGDLGLKVNGPYSEEFQAKNGGQDELHLPSGKRRHLEGNFVDALRGKGPVHCNVDLCCATMVAIKVAVESYRQRKSFLWEPAPGKMVTA